MRKVYSCIDIGSHSTKLVIIEKIEDQFVVLSRFIVKSKGIQKGMIVQEDEALFAIKKAISKAEEDLHIQIREILCLIPSCRLEFSMVSGEVPITGEISKDEISDVLKEAVVGQIDESRALVSISPIFYKVDDEENLKDVRGLSGESLGVKAIAATVSKSFLRPFFTVFKRLGIAVVDIGFGLVGDYYAARDRSLEKSVAAVVNIGYSKTEVGIFNKGILIKADQIDIGSKYIDRDISYAFQIEKKKARYLKETFAVSNTRYADASDSITVEDKTGQVLTINQLKISEIVEARLLEILKFAKKQISVLTNREIRYIIVTGGISELAGFQYVLENVFGRCANVLSMNKMGVRSNSYSSCVGFVEYFDEKLQLRDQAYSMIEDKELEVGTKNKRKTNGEGGLGSFLNYLTGNKED